MFLLSLINVRTRVTAHSQRSRPAPRDALPQGAPSGTCAGGHRVEHRTHTLGHRTVEHTQ